MASLPGTAARLTDPAYAGNMLFVLGDIVVPELSDRKAPSTDENLRLAYRVQAVFWLACSGRLAVAI